MIASGWVLWKTNSKTNIGMQDVNYGMLGGSPSVEGKGGRQDWTEGDVNPLAVDFVD